MADTKKEPIKGRARFNVTDSLIQQADVKLEKPKAGQICWGIMEVKELFDTFQSFLLLPEGYAIIGVFFEVAFDEWVLLVESDAIPLPPDGQMLPRLIATYRRTDDGKVSLTDLQAMQ